MLRAFSVLVAGLAAFTLAAQDAAKDAPASGAFLGVVLGDIPEELAAHLDVAGGSMVLQVLPGSPAAKAGLKRHDVLVSAGGEKVPSASSVTDWMRKRKAGEEVIVKVLRKGETKELMVTLGQRPSSTAAPAVEPEIKKPGFLGVQFEPVPEILAVHLKLEEGRGAVIIDVFEDSSAARGGLKNHDVVVAIDGEKIERGDVAAGVAGKFEGDSVELEVIQRGERKELTVTLGARPDELPAPAGGWFQLLPRGFEKGRHEFRVLPPRFRGRFFLRGPDGEERVFELPEWSGELKGLGLKLEKKLEEHFGRLPEEMQKNFGDIEKRLRGLAEKFESSAAEFELDFGLDLSALKGLGFGRPGTKSFESSGTHSTVRVIDGGFDVTVTDDNGRRTVTVRKAGDVIATDLPIDKLDSLDEDVQKRVRKILDGSETGKSFKLRLKIDDHEKKKEKKATPQNEPRNVKV